MREHHDPGHYTAQDTRTLGIFIFMEAHRRLLGGKFGAIPKPIKEWAFAEGGYCIDAPDSLPAGACKFFDLDPTGLEGLANEFGHYGVPTQIMVERDASGLQPTEGERDA